MNYLQLMEQEVLALLAFVVGAFAFGVLVGAALASLAWWIWR